MSTPQDQERIGHQADLPRELLPEAAARRAEEEALNRTVDISGEAAESRRRGRIEAETRRVSEEVTRQAQERLRQNRARIERETSPAHSGDEHLAEDVTETGIPGRALPELLSIERVLLPLDGSSFAERALPYSVALARGANAALVLAHVRQPKQGRARALLSTVVDSTTPEAPEQPVKDAAAYLAAIRDRIGTRLPRVETALLSADTAADGLVPLVASGPPGVVVLATHMRQGLERRLLGSVGDQLVQRTHMPVLLIPPALKVRSQPTPTLRRFLVPLDGSLLAEQALAPVLALAAGAETSDDGRRMAIVLYYVAESHVTRPAGARYVATVRDRLLQAHLPSAVSITAAATVGSPPGAITSAAIHGVITEASYPEQFDLVVMATHGRGGFQRWLYGSVAEYVIAHVGVPTLLVHPELTDM
ncbi:MAG TPA: universal stress protein [Ktedonobacterales bacterium]|nr:universal stress protein [Ktedonobacterales bacterium]